MDDAKRILIVMSRSTLLTALLGVVLAAASLLSPTLAQSTGSGQDPQTALPAGFSPDTVRSALAVSLPGSWHLDGFTSQATLNTGSLIEPVMRTRFEAVLTLVNDTYAEDGRDGPMTFVRKVANAGMKKTLYGLSTSTLQAGSWTTRFDMQDAAVLQGIGESLATLPGRVIVRGSQDEADYLKERDRAAAQAQQATLAANRQQQELQAQQRAADAAAAAARRDQAATEALAQAKQQAAVETVKAEQKRQQEQLDAEAAARLTQTKAAAEQVRLQQQRDLEAVQQAALQTRTRYLEELRAALQSQSRSERLAAIDGALTSTDLTVRTLGFDAALGGVDPAAQNIGLRRFFEQKRLIVFSLFAPSGWKQGEEPPTNVIAALGGMRIDIKQFDVTTGRFSGDLLFGPNLQWDAAGSIDRNMMSLTARGPGKPLRLYGDPVSLAFVLQLSPEKEMDGFAQVGGTTGAFKVYSPVIVRVNLD